MNTGGFISQEVSEEILKRIKAMVKEGTIKLPDFKLPNINKKL